MKKLREFFRNIDLKRETTRVKRNKAVCSLSSARSVGVLYIVGEEHDQIILSNFVSELQKGGREVKALGYVNYKDIPHYCYPKLSYDYITRKNLNWFHKPSGEKFRDFISRDFDLLLTLDKSGHPVMRYAAALSKARFKAGVYSREDESIHDLMLVADSINSMPQLMDEMMRYIDMFTQNNKNSV